MKIIWKITIPMIGVFLLSILLVGSGFYMLEKNTVITNTTQGITKQAAVLLDKVTENEKSLEEVKEQVNQDYIARAKALATMIAYTPSIADSLSTLGFICQRLDIEEIHLINQDGILTSGTNPDFYGVDFAATEQTASFLPILHDSLLEVAQDPTPRGTDNLLFQYIGVARLDKPGIVQIGVNPTRLEDKLKATNIADITNNLTFNTNGYLLLVDAISKEVISSPIKSDIGQSATTLFDYTFLTPTGDFTYTLEGTTYFAHYLTSGDYLIIGTIPNSYLTQQLTETFGMFSILIITVLLLIILTIIYLIRRYVIRELYQLQHILVTAKNGDFSSRLNLRATKEFSTISLGVNQLLESIDTMLSASTHTTTTLEKVNDRLETIVSQTTSSMEEIAQNTLELSHSNDAQVEKIATGETIVQSIYEHLSDINNRAAQSVSIANEAQRLTTSGSQELTMQVQHMHEVVTDFTLTATAVDALEKHTKSIHNIVDVINKITGQIQLVAFNASIEAARVGEAGKGFTVVSNEIKKLASNSQQATQEIGTIISSITKNIKEVTAHTTRSMDAITLQQAEIEKTGAHFNHIVSAVNQTLSDAQKIQENTNTIIELASHITNFMKELKEASIFTNNTSSEINASIQEEVAITIEMKAMTEELGNLVRSISNLFAHVN